MKKAVRVAVTGAAGQISYSLLFRIAAGEMLGKDQPIILQLLELPHAMQALQGVVMELQDCAFPLLRDIEVSDSADIAFRDIDYALLVGAKPRSKGMERADLLQGNANIFKKQAIALDKVANEGVKILVVGNPANTNALIVQKNVRNIHARQIHAMMRLDHNRAISQLALKLQTTVNDIHKIIIWGNHSASQYPDIAHADLAGQSLSEILTDNDWLENNFIPTVQKRGAQIIEARGASSAASAANAAIEHIRDWQLGTVDGDWVTMGVPSDGSYGIDKGIVFGFPCYCHNGDYEIVQNLEWNDFAKAKISKSYKELLAEKEAVADYL